MNTREIKPTDLLLYNKIDVCNLKSHSKFHTVLSFKAIYTINYYNIRSYLLNIMFMLYHIGINIWMPTHFDFIEYKALNCLLRQEQFFNFEFRI
jgi:hypothetical protein